MPGNLSKLVRPTGFENLERQAKSRRDLADAMLADTGGVQPLGSWTQVLAKVLEGYGGKRLQGQADKLDSTYTDKVLAAFTNADKNFNTDVSSGMSNEDLVNKYHDNQFIGDDDLKPYREAMTAALRKRAENPETLARAPDGSYKPITSMTGPQFDPQATVIPDENGGYRLNPLKITADRLAQGNGPPINAVTSMPAPGQASAPPQNAGGMDLGLLKPDERQILAQELARRASGGGQVAGPDPHIPMGNPLTARPKPDGVTTDGRPYWMVNGTPYDNPEGK